MSFATNIKILLNYVICQRSEYITARRHHRQHQSLCVLSSTHQRTTNTNMKAFFCVALLAAVALAAPEGKRDKRGYLSSGYLSSGWLDSDLSAYSLDRGLSSYSLDGPIISHSIISKPTIVHEPAVINQPTIISVKKVVDVPKVISVKKIVSVPRVVSVPQVNSHISSYEPAISSGWCVMTLLRIVWHAPQWRDAEGNALRVPAAALTNNIHAPNTI
ncbi:unnamed protein product [Arctia plantaginis]|uniref:Uncharacterized protein n=1 Tax=Arctia plantaginis TaxID=874455 RepID=A0A8S0Z5J8_ARCPL|nr:unnamed protein product [Arctia plantaginis]